MAETHRHPVTKPPKRPVWGEGCDGDRRARGVVRDLVAHRSPSGWSWSRSAPWRWRCIPSPKRQASRGVGAPADESEADRTIEVATLDTMSFEPSEIEVSAGETVTFVVTNAGQFIHEFTIGDEAMQQEHAEAMEHIPAGMAHATANSITLQPGETKRLTWRFGDTALEYACHQADHYEAGMRGRITVT
jgi:uncharacterized cupredoxin-like copper-binding protein